MWSRPCAPTSQEGAAGGRRTGGGPDDVRRHRDREPAARGPDGPAEGRAGAAGGGAERRLLPRPATRT